ncbi:hypothetical protein MTO96_040834 [Rhipicephalus appendiculatus]
MTAGITTAFTTAAVVFFVGVIFIFYTVAVFVGVFNEETGSSTCASTGANPRFIIPYTGARPFVEEPTMLAAFCFSGPIVGVVDPSLPFHLNVAFPELGIANSSLAFSLSFPLPEIMVLSSTLAFGLSFALPEFGVFRPTLAFSFGFTFPEFGVLCSTLAFIQSFSFPDLGSFRSALAMSRGLSGSHRRIGPSTTRAFAGSLSSALGESRLFFGGTHDARTPHAFAADTGPRPLQFYHRALN